MGTYFAKAITPLKDEIKALQNEIGKLKKQLRERSADSTKNRRTDEELLGPVVWNERLTNRKALMVMN